MSTSSAEHFIFNHLEMAGEPLFENDKNPIQPKRLFNFLDFFKLLIKEIQQAVSKFIVKYLKTDGLFILRLIAQHADVVIFLFFIYYFKINF